MPVRHANAVWNGDLRDGDGTMALGNGTFEGGYSFASRFESGDGTNPEELLGAAHAGCFSMALANELAEAGYEPRSLDTDAAVTLEAETLSIGEIDLTLEATVPGIDEETFLEFAEGAKANCPVSKALAGVDITLETTLVE
ncbi:MAG: OsmC family protein [Halodesulfurarchaeum sp.]